MICPNNRPNNSPSPTVFTHVQLYAVVCSQADNPLRLSRIRAIVNTSDYDRMALIIHRSQLTSRRSTVRVCDRPPFKSRIIENRYLTFKPYFCVMGGTIPFMRRYSTSCRSGRSRAKLKSRKCQAWCLARHIGLRFGPVRCQP